MTKVTNFSAVAHKYHGDKAIKNARKALCAQRLTLWDRIVLWLNA